MPLYSWIHGGQVRMALTLAFDVQLFIPSATLQRIPAMAPLASLLVLSSEDILSPTREIHQLTLSHPVCATPPRV